MILDGIRSVIFLTIKRSLAQCVFFPVVRAIIHRIKEYEKSTGIVPSNKKCNYPTKTRHDGVESFLQYDL